MFPLHDIICILSETPLSRFREEDKEEVFSLPRPTPVLHLNETLYEQFQWLCGSDTLKKLFCWPCTLFNTRKLAKWSLGFNRISNITQVFENHEASTEHLKCALSFKKLKNVNPPLPQNSEVNVAKFNDNVQLNRRFMKLLIDVMLYLGKQELTFKSKDVYDEDDEDDDEPGIFEAFLEFFVKICPEDLRYHYETNKHIFSEGSETLQIEIINCITEYVDETICKEVNEASCFTLKIDTAVMDDFQWSIIINYVDSTGKLVERFLGLYDYNEKRTAETLFDLILSVLKGFNCYETKMIAQCYDGAAVLPGHLNDVQNRIKGVVPQAGFFHCLSQSLNSILKQRLSRILKCCLVFGSVARLPSLLRNYNKKIKVEDSAMEISISSVEQTKWASNAKIFNAILLEWDNLKEAFEEILDDSQANDISIREASNFLDEFYDIEFTFLVCVFDEIFELINILDNVFVENPLNINYCLSQIKITCEDLQSLRHNEKFLQLFSAASLKTPLLQSDLTDTKFIEKYQLLYSEIFDVILVEIDVRFKDMDKLLFISLADSNKFNEYQTQFPVEALHSLRANYSNMFSDQDLNRLKNELEIMYVDAQYRDKNLQELTQLLREYVDVFKETYKLFCLILTLPFTNSYVDQNYSCLKKVEGYLSNPVSQKKLSALCKISVEQELIQKLKENRPFYDDVINKFAALKDRPLDLICK